jgi:hypothetical protein
MTELDLLNLARSMTANEIGFFTQIITITFAMIVAIFYFLNRAGLAIRIFAFIAYSLGFFLFLGEMLIEGSDKIVVMRLQRSLPHPSAITLEYLGVTHSWLGDLTAVLFNFAIWILWLGVFYLLFFGRRHLAEDTAGK